MSRSSRSYWLRRDQNARYARWEFAVVLALLLAACGGSSPTSPVGASEPPALVAPQPAAPPAFMDGYFTTPRSHGAWAPGSTQVIVPSFGEDAAAAAEGLQRAGAFAFISAHHCFGNPPAYWEPCWTKTKAWMEPIERTGRVLGIYVVDEPFHNGITQPNIEAAVAIVRAAGYRTMVAESYPMYARGRYVPPVDFFGLTAYYTPPAWTVDRYREEPRLNVVFASSADDDEAMALARSAGARGIFRWSLDMGAASR